MIRFILIGNQITLEEGDQHFAFYDTVSDNFVRINGVSVFSNKADLNAEIIYCLSMIHTRKDCSMYSPKFFERMRSLIPDSIK